MISYFIRRPGFVLPGLLLITVLAFGLLRLTPGDPALVYAGLDADAEYIARIRTEMGLDEPLPVQYLAWLRHAITGDLGVSTTGQDVTYLLGEAIPKTIELGLVAIIVHVGLAFVIGVIAALKRDSVVDVATTGLALALISIPSFVVAFALIILFTIRFRLFPPGGYVPFGEGAIEHLRTLVLPALSLGAGALAVVMRHTRSSVVEALDDGYIRTARAKGLRERTVVVRHAVRNALIPVTTVIGLQVGAVLEGAIIVETIFSWPGVGRLTVNSIQQRDYAVVQGAVLVIAIWYMLSNLLTDMAYARLDPRISYAQRVAAA